MPKKYKVKTRVDQNYNGRITTKYMIRKRTFFGWFDVHEEWTTDKSQVESACRELNESYEKNHTRKNRIRDVESKVK